MLMENTITAACTPSTRLYALDNLRALMMWLGIVLHVAVIYTVQPLPNIPWHDRQSTPLADFFLGLIHTFRMPVFFILAGFFIALMVQKRGAKQMLKNRLQRLGLPFVVFWLPVFVSMVVFLLLFAHLMVRGTWGLDLSLLPTGAHVPTGPSTMHLWFLWMLICFSVLTAGVHWLMPHLPSAVTVAVARPVAQFFARLGGAWWGFFVLALPLAWVGSFYDQGLLAPSGSFLPPLAEWVHNGLFYVFGWYLHGHQQTMFERYTRRWPMYAAAGLVFFAIAVLLLARLERPDAATLHLPWWIALAYNCASWLWSFALIGVFLRYLGRPHPVLGYLAESSYWVYIVHMPLTIGFGAVLYSVALPALAKMGLNVLATTVVCLVSYQLFVRYTGVGALLNGRRAVRA
jgi:glucan biosynthesis protein C